MVIISFYFSRLTGNELGAMSVSTTSLTGFLEPQEVQANTRKKSLVAKLDDLKKGKQILLLVTYTLKEYTRLVKM